MARTAVAPAGNDAAAGTRIGLSGTHLVRALLLTPWIFWLLSPFALQIVHIQPAIFSSSVTLWWTSEGFRIALATIAMGVVALTFSHALEAGRRCKLPTPKQSDASTAQVAGLRGWFSWHLNARSMLVWDPYDCAETTIISVCLACGSLGGRIIRRGWHDIATDPIHIGVPVGMCVLSFVVAFIFKRVLSGITDVQRERMPAFVMGTAVPTLALALCFMLYLTLVYANAGLSYPYNFFEENYMARMLAIGNNSRIQCDDEAAFWDTFFNT